MSEYEALKTAMADLDEDAFLDAINGIVAQNGDAQKAVEACQQGMAIVGDRFEGGEYFVGDLVYAGEMLTSGMDILKPLLGAGNADKTGKMILCTVKGDIHDIGKNIVKSILETNGFDVVDLGIDIAPEAIIDSAKKDDIKIIALSGVLTLALDSMKETVDAIRAAGMGDDVKVIVGGTPVNEDACKYIGADEWAQNPQKTVSVCRAWAAG